MSANHWLGIDRLFNLTQGAAEPSATQIASTSVAMAPVQSAHRWTDWEADSLFDEDETNENLSGDMFDVTASPIPSPVADQLSCDDQTDVEPAAEPGNQLSNEKMELAVIEQQKKTLVNEQKPTFVIDLIDSPSPIPKAQKSSVWLSCRKKKQTRLDFYLRPSAASHKALRPTFAQDVASSAATDCQRSVNLLPTQAPQSIVQDDTIEINSSADELPLSQVLSSQPISSHAEPARAAVQRTPLDTTVAPFTPVHSKVGSALLEQTVAPSPLHRGFTPELCPINEESTANDSRIITTQLQEPAPLIVNAESKQIPSSSFLNAYDDFELPRRDGPKVGEVVRSKKDRVQLHGYDCMCCKNYYDGLNLSPKSREARINQVSRHRAVQMMPLTPEHYWEVDMPNTQECIKRGYIKDSPYVRRQPKNWRPRRQRTKNKDDGAIVRKMLD